VLLTVSPAPGGHMKLPGSSGPPAFSCARPGLPESNLRCERQPAAFARTGRRVVCSQTLLLH
jgi:hypothetical protein